MADALGQIPIVGEYLTALIPPNFKAEFFWEIIGELFFCVLSLDDEKNTGLMCNVDYFRDCVQFAGSLLFAAFLCIPSLRRDPQPRSGNCAVLYLREYQKTHNGLHLHNSAHVLICDIWSANL